MSETLASVPTSEPAAPAPESPAGTPQSSPTGAAQASGGDVFAPAPPEATLAGDGQVLPPQTPASEFVFGGRRFASQKAAEEYFRSQTGRVPDLQRKTAEYERQMSELTSTVQALQRALSVQPTSPERGQGNGRQSQTNQPQSFADKLVASGDLQFITELAESKGLGHAIYALADIMGNEIKSIREQIHTEEIHPFLQQQQFKTYEQQAIGSVRQIGQEFPEFDAQNQSPEAVAAQQEFVSTLQSFPPGEVTQNPDLYMLATALITRYKHGIPIFAQEPGSSGSPSARAVLAQEQALGGSNPIDSSATRPNLRAPQGESPADRRGNPQRHRPGGFRTNCTPSTSTCGRAAATTRRPSCTADSCSAGRRWASRSAARAAPCLAIGTSSANW